MHVTTCTFGADGRALRVGARGIGFHIAPGVPPGAGDTVRLGSWPLTVVPRRGGARMRPLVVTSGGAFWLADEFDSLDLEGGNAGDAWVVTTFEKRAEGVVPHGKVRRTAKVAWQTGDSVPTAAPAANGVGIRVTEATRGLNLAFGGTTTRVVTIWQRMRGGAWTADNVSTIAPSADGELQYRSVLAGAEEVYLRADGAGLTAEINVVEEAG